MRCDKRLASIQAKLCHFLTVKSSCNFTIHPTDNGNCSGQVLLMSMCQRYKSHSQTADLDCAIPNAEHHGWDIVRQDFGNQLGAPPKQPRHYTCVLQHIYAE
ncbi:TPA: hypothetical protein ACH3X1_009832 [Trebouxia sp. C0004]